MDSLIALLKDTPIPTILVVSGIIFLFLAMAGKVAGQLEMPPARQKWSGVVSAVLITTGLVLYTLPVSAPVAPGNSSPSSDLPVATGENDLVQPVPAQGKAAPVLTEAVANPIQEADEGCLAELFSGIPASNIQRVESGVEDKRFSAQRINNSPAGIVLLELGQPVLALTYLVIEEDKLFKLGAVVDASCRSVEFANASRGGAKDVILFWDSLQVTTGSGMYTLRLGYVDGMVELDAHKLPE